jgi:hypothetical protein
MTRAADIHCWLLRHAERLLLIVGCLFFGVLGIVGDLTTFLLGSPLNDPSSAIRLDGVVNVFIGGCCLALATIEAHELTRRP